MTLLSDLRRMSDDEIAEYAMCRNIILHNFKDGLITPMMRIHLLKQLEAVFGVDSDASRGRY